ncbi:unnamed protein product [Cuscuta europaea]|uniref:Uncharacterized protein n=1 Tax=Cuscuta europaea TaxID=41803 RepID=A0A9P0ZLE6_CUSEU|nr:unnamed protein product [Cuscuta europaea]
MAENGRIRICKILYAALTIPFFLSIPILAVDVLLGNSCADFKSLQTMLVTCGVVMLLCGALAFVAMYFQDDDVLFWVSVIQFFAAFFVLMFLVFVVLEMSKLTGKSGSPEPVPNRAYEEYRYDRFSASLRKTVSRWDYSVLNCVAPSGSCVDFNATFDFNDFAAHLTPLHRLDVVCHLQSVALLL